MARFPLSMRADDVTCHVLSHTAVGTEAAQGRAALRCHGAGPTHVDRELDSLTAMVV